jgi:hypothetical protein
MRSAEAVDHPGRLSLAATLARGQQNDNRDPISLCVERRLSMLTPTKFYERRAMDCVQAAGRTDNPKHREQLLKLAYEWAQAAALRASLQSNPQRMGSRVR